MSVLLLLGVSTNIPPTQSFYAGYIHYFKRSSKDRKPKKISLIVGTPSEKQVIVKLLSEKLSIWGGLFLK